jgi:amino acid adenylation domain-containing protein
MQQGMLFHHLMEPQSGVDIQQLVVHLPEEVDAGRLEAAWQWLVRRHDILRARFVWEGIEEPQQEIAAEVSVRFVVEDARHLSEHDQRERLASFLKTDRLRGFELDSAPMLRLTLFQWGGASLTLVWTFHHALLDGRCYPVLLREVFEAYAELAQGDITARAAPPPYRRYIDWLQHQNLADARLYWKEKLAGFVAPTPLGIDRPVPAEEPLYQQGEAWEILDSALTARLRVFAKENGLTLNALVMGAWAILLHRYSGNQDIVFGATRACRKSTVAGADEMIGLFINTLPVRLKLSPDDAALSVFKAARQQWLDMRPYEHTPLVQVKGVSEVPPTQPLFETLLVFENYRLDTAMRSLGGPWARRQVELHRLTDFAIRLLAYDGQELSFKIEFDRRRLDAAAIPRLLGHLRRLLEGVVTNPTETVGRLPILTEAEYKVLTVDWNRTDVDIPKRRTLHEWIETQVESTPDAHAVTFEGKDITYRELNHRANQVAHHLQGLGVGPDVPVGVFLERSLEMVVALLGILKAGGAYLPLDPDYPKDRLAFMLEDAEPPVLLTHSELVPVLPEHRSKIVCFDTDKASLDREPDTNPLQSCTRENLAYVIYTSGSTGRPKGVPNQHAGVVNRLLWMQGAYRLDGTDRVLQKTPYSFDVSVWEFFWPLMTGACLVVARPEGHQQPDYLVNVIREQKITTMHFVPSMLRIFLESQGVESCRSLRRVFCSGEALPLELQKRFFQLLGAELHNLYGPTEAAVDVTYWQCTPNSRLSIVPIGRPIWNTQIYILDKYLQPVPIGIAGELHIGGAGLARGYLKRPEMTAERFISDPFSGRARARLYKTGDLARFLPDGNLEYLGRTDHQVKIRGFRIELGEIEAVLCQHPAVREAVVIAREDVPGEKRLVGYLVARPPQPEVRALRELLKKKLPEYMVPALFVFLEKLPLTASGKADRKALPAPEQQQPELDGRFVPPETEMERKIARVWKEVLGMDHVSIDEHFFDLGGHSLLLVRVHGRLRETLRTEFPIVTLFEHPTVGSLAAHLSQLDSPAPKPTEQWRDRALHQQQALAQLRLRANK